MNHKEYVPAAATDISKTFRRFGFEPPSELAVYQAKWAYYKSLHLRGGGNEEAEQSVQTEAH